MVLAKKTLTPFQTEVRAFIITVTCYTVIAQNLPIPGTAISVLTPRMATPKNKNVTPPGQVFFTSSTSRVSFKIGAVSVYHINICVKFLSILH